MITILRLKCLVLKGHQPSLGVVGEAAVQCLPHRRPRVGAKTSSSLRRVLPDTCNDMRKTGSELYTEKNCLSAAF